jgi:type I restriction enzyme M protein
VDKENAHTRKGIFLVDASKGFLKDGPKNRLREQDIHQIVDVFTRQLEIPRYSRMVSIAEIEKNEYNLNLPRYIDSQEPEDLQDIAGHLQGGIPSADVDALSRYWAVCPQLRATLFAELRPGYLRLAVDKSAIRPAINKHPEFARFMAGMESHFAGWRATAAATLKALQPGCHPKSVIADLGESLLAHYADMPLIGKYDVYQHLMDYWAATMQDDCYLIAAHGWKAAPYRITEKDRKGQDRDKGWTCDLVPKPLIVARYFAGEQAAIIALEADIEGLAARMTELEEEHGGEEGLFSELERVNKAAVTARLREIRGDREARDEAGALNAWLTLANEEAGLKRHLKDAETSLDAGAYGQYSRLTSAEVQTLVVEDKWLAALATAIHGEMDRISQTLTRRVKELAERYETPLPQLASRVIELEAKVAAHLQRMGFHP